MPDRTGFRLRDLLADVAAGQWPEAPSLACTDGLRHRLETALAPVVDRIPTHALPLRAPKRRMTDVLGCELGMLAGLGAVPPPDRTGPGHLVDRLVHGHVLGFGTGGDDPLRFARDALEADAADETLAWLDTLDDTARASLHQRLTAVAAALVDGWGPVDGAWWPRCEQPVTVPLLHGRVLASGRFDVALGGPGTGRRGVIVEVKSGGAAAHQRPDLHWYALLAAWAWGEAPAMVATWSATDDALSPEPVGEGMLEAACRRAEHAIGRLAALAAGDQPAVRPSARCAWCSMLDTCESGLAHLRAGAARDAAEGWTWAWEDDDDEASW